MQKAKNSGKWVTNILKHYQQYKYHIVIDDDLKLRKRGGKESAEIKKLSANDVINFFPHSFMNLNIQSFIIS